MVPVTLKVAVLADVLACKTFVYDVPVTLKVVVFADVLACNTSV